MKSTLTVYSNDVLAKNTKIERVVKEGMATYKNKKYLVHRHNGTDSINMSDPIQTSLDTYPDDDVIAHALNRINKRVQRGCFLESPDAVKELCILKLGRATSESFNIIHLDNRHKVIAWSTLFTGTIDSCSAHTREILFDIFKYNSAAIILSHPHPNSHDCTPSRADISITATVKKLCESISCRLLDHIIVAGNNSLSMAERGEL